MKILSLFDGISCARVALERAGFSVEYYLASEIDKYAIEISRKNYPSISQIGGVQEIVGSKLYAIRKEEIDLLIGGSPCQDLSIAKKDRKGLSGDRSGLFWEYVRILNEVKPKYFILENVNSMPKEAKALITETLGVEPIMIDAALVSAQRRKRLFWTNIPNVTLPEDRGILLKDILEDGDTVINPKLLNFKGDTEESMTITATAYKEPPIVLKQNELLTFRHRKDERIRITKGGKSPTMQASWGTGGNNVPYVSNIPITVAVIPEAPRPKGNYLPRERVLSPNGKFRAVSTVSNQQPWIEQTPRGYNKGGKKYDKVPTLSTSAWEHNHKLNGIRKLTPMECERLQSLPDNYTEGVSNTQRYKALGNAFNVEVVKHILTFLPPPPQPVEACKIK